jgi:hypothetical protein
MTAAVYRSSKTALLALIGVSIAGTGDVAQFLFSRMAMFTDAPGRAAGSLLGLAAWASLLGIVSARLATGERRLIKPTLWFAGLVAVGEVGLTAIHLKVGVGGWRPMVGGVLGVLALILALATRDQVTGS